MFDTAKNAGLLPSDIAKLLKIHRVTVSLWYSGKNRPHTLLATRVNKLLDAVAAAVQAGDFPLPDGISRRERGPYIERAVIKHLMTAKASTAPA